MECGDIIFTHDGGIFSKLIRFFTRRINNDVVMTHCGLAVYKNIFIETNIRTRLVPIREIQENEYYEIWRNPELTDSQRQIIRDAALDYFGRYYGFFKLILHALDACLGKIFLKDIFLFRRLSTNDRYIICSWLVGSVYNKIGINFTDPYQMATPDDIHDYVKENNWILVEKKE